MKKEWINADGMFQYLKAQQLEDLAEELHAEYKEAEAAHINSRIKALEGADSNDHTKEIEELKQSLFKLQTEQFDTMKNNIVAMGKELASIKEAGKEVDMTPFKTAIVGFEDSLKALKTGGSSVEFEIKADVTYADLTHTGQLDQVAAGISDAPKKRVRLFELFRKIPMTTETYSYLSQKDSVLRDAQGVAKCAKGFSSTTKEEIEIVRINDVKIKDDVDLCRDYMDDFSWVEARYRLLLSDSVMFEMDRQLLLGLNTGTSMNSIDAVSSEFSALNVDAPVGATIEKANMADLILAMATQVDVLGKLASFNVNSAVVNKLNWFILVESKKDTQGRYLDPRISKINGNYYVGDILVIPLPDVAENTLYVMDSTKGSILDRKKQTLRISTENGTNFADEFITMMSTVRAQFLVEQNHANAFMKCSDVATAVSAINKP